MKKKKYLSHADREWEDHKYIDKEWKNGRWNYIYKTASSAVASSSKTVLKSAELDKAIATGDKEGLIKLAHELRNSGKIDKETGLTLKSEPMTLLQDAKLVNPEREGAKLDSFFFTNNCYRCSVAFQMRRMGYEVAAAGVVDGARTDFVKNIFNGEDVDKFTKHYMEKGVMLNDTTDISEKASRFEKGIKQMAKQWYNREGDNSGIVLCGWMPGGGHAFNYEIKDGKLTIIDSQIGFVGTAEEYTRLTGGQMEYCQMVPTDRAKLNTAGIKAADDGLASEWENKLTDRYYKVDKEKVKRDDNSAVSTTRGTHVPIRSNDEFNKKATSDLDNMITSERNAVNNLKTRSEWEAERADDHKDYWEEVHTEQKNALIKDYNIKKGLKATKTKNAAADSAKIKNEMLSNNPKAKTTYNNNKAAESAKKKEEMLNNNPIMKSTYTKNKAGGEARKEEEKKRNMRHSSLAYDLVDDDYLAHHGIKGQKWGVRRWQNQDGSLTPDGRIHYGRGQKKESEGMGVRAGLTAAKALTENAAINAIAPGPLGIGLSVANTARLATKFGKKEMSRVKAEEAAKKMKEAEYETRYQRELDAAERYRNSRNSSEQQVEGFGDSLRAISRGNMSNLAKRASDFTTSGAEFSKVYRYKTAADAAREAANSSKIAGLVDIKSGSATEAYLSNKAKRDAANATKAAAKAEASAAKASAKAAAKAAKSEAKAAKELARREADDIVNSRAEQIVKSGMSTGKKVAIGLGITAAAAGIGYGIYKHNQKKKAEAAAREYDAYERYAKQRDKERSAASSPEYVYKDNNGRYYYQDDIDAHQRAEKAEQYGYDYVYGGGRRRKGVKHDGLNGRYLAHHGVKGQKWGVRRWQNEDGSWTPEGNARRRKGSSEVEGLGISDEKAFKRVGKGKDTKMIEEGMKLADKFEETYKRAYKVSDDIGKEYWNDKDAVAKYQSLGATYEELFNPKATISDVINRAKDNINSKYDEEDVGITMYAIDKGKRDDIMDAELRLKEIGTAIDLTSDITARKYLGKYFDEKYKKNYRTAGDKAQFSMYYSAYSQLVNRYGGYNDHQSNMAGMIKVFESESGKKNYEKAKKLESRFPIKQTRSGWEAFNSAVKKLGYGDLPYAELTSSQVAEINKLAAQLKKD